MPKAVTIIRSMCMGALLLLCNAADRPLSVCEVLKSPDKYNGKVVTLRGQLLVGREVFAIGGGRCEEKAATGTGSVVNAIDLQITKKHQSTSEAESIRKMDSLLSFLHDATAESLGVEIFATFTGELQAGDGSSAFIGPGVISLPKTYGHMGRFPAQLLYTRVDGIVIRQKTEQLPPGDIN